MILPSEKTTKGVELNGFVDGRANRKKPSSSSTDVDIGWQELCADMGWDITETLLYNAYKDGWYRGMIAV